MITHKKRFHHMTQSCIVAIQYFTTSLTYKWWRIFTLWTWSPHDITAIMSLWLSALWYIFDHSDITEHHITGHTQYGTSSLNLLPSVIFFHMGKNENNWVRVFILFGYFWCLESLKYNISWVIFVISTVALGSCNLCFKSAFNGQPDGSDG